MKAYYARDVARTGAPPASLGETSREVGTEQSEPERWVVCNTCGGFVADARAKSVVNGAFSHSFINPAGLIFRVGCFADAPGVRSIGEASDHWTWFPGFKWQAGLCAGCGEHLGWHFHGTERGFVGLILDKVSERISPGSAEA